MPRVVLLLSILLCCGAIADDTAPSSAPVTAPATNPAERVWNLNSYLHGTPAEIREQINGEFDRLIRLRASRIEVVKGRTGAGRDGQARLKEAKDLLKETESALARAYLWRRRLVDAVRNEFMLRWPLTPGASGVLGIVTPLRIDPANHSITIRFPALEVMQDEDHVEGIRRQKMFVHDVTMVVTGADINHMKVGMPVALDQNYVVLAKQDDPRTGPVYTVMRKTADVDVLLAAMNDLHETIEPKEMSRLIREAVPRKSDPKTWRSIERIFSTTRPMRDTAVGSPDFKRMASWLEKQLPGDRFAMRVNVLKVLPGDDGNYDLHATIDTGDGRVHFITGILLPSATDRGLRSEGEHEVRIVGTILDAHLSQENTLILELID
ncbi:MAG TPA: hypothetical protein VL282_02090, partial [Tepidisphaeraceae bacterium]|nr:hypothetical protein [Tepidisphaeraceae bacterium]